MASRSRPAPPDANPDADWPASIQDYYWLHNILRLEPRLRWLFVLWREQQTRWLEISEESGRLQPFHFEAYFCRRGERDRYLAECFRRTRSLGGLYLGSHRGFSDLFYPVKTDRRGGTFIYAGQLRPSPLRVDDVRELWAALSGRDPVGTDPDYRRFAEVATDVPVLPPPVLAALDAHLALFVRYLKQVRGAEPAFEQVLELRQEVFVHHYAQRAWMECAVDADRFQLTPWRLEKRFSQWMQQEMGICRAPTTVLALMPLLPAEVAADPVASLVRAREVQWVVAQYAREMRETAAAPLEDYGVYLLTSTRNRVSPERQQEELVARAEELRRLVGKRCGLDATVGIGSSHEPGERLAGSYRAAIVALHVALTRGVRIQVARSAADDPTTLDDVRRAAHELRGSLLEHRAHELGAVLGRFCHSVVSVAGSHAELGRGCFELTLFELRDVARRELGMGAERAAEWVRDDLGSLGAARSIHEMVTVFRAAVTRLAAAIRGGVASDAARFSAVLAYVDERHAERLTLERVARATGYSVPTLTRTFKRVTGTSFLGYVVARRLEHARRLLRATDLTVERVAACSGFGSVQHFLRTFRRHDSCSPAEYRASERFRDGDSA